MKEEVKNWREQLAMVQRCTETLRECRSKNQELLQNIPTQALRKSLPSSRSQSDQSWKSQEKSSGSKKAQGADQEAKPPLVVKDVGVSVSHLTLEEFEKVPKYMKGRLTYDSLSQAVEEFNSCLRGKYEFLGKSLSELSLKEKKKRNILKSQDKPELRGKYFLTTDELKDFSMYKTENSKKAAITVLRHFQGIRENRGPGSLIRYVVV